MNRFHPPHSIARAWYGEIIGPLTLAQTAVYGRFGRSQMGPISRKLKAHNSVGGLSSEERAVFIDCAKPMEAIRGGPVGCSWGALVF